ncbi:ABC transporter substrate-binding protein [Natronoarchaeum mannanilyticum]|uniref:Solute-binding protein family 5 domain-containing protein n=1 Tax=Natronoarchaeum mannanilyticum TaxID=926360 RepID=A0AAV3TC58_9EURY
MPSPRSGPNRREMLAALGATALGSTAGCTNALSRFAWSSPDSVSLTIATVPANVDTAATQMARQLETNLEAAGIDASYEPQSEGSLLRTVLMEQDFDLFIARHPGVSDPDELRGLLHTTFSEEAGWQNPFGFNEPAVDDLLETQKTQTGDERMGTVTDLQTQLLERQPFTVLAYPDQLSVASTDLNLERTPGGLIGAHDYLRLGAANPDVDRLRVGHLGGSITRNRNPLAVAHHSRTDMLGLLYEPLVKRVDGEYLPWLAASVDWVDDAEEMTVRVSLRDDLRWHDGERLDATDAEFTYQFLQDTAMGNESTPIPAPRFRSESSAVTSTSTPSNYDIELSFGDATRDVAIRSLTVPLLPRHIWIERTGLVREYMTRALVWDNESAIGCGPYRFENANVGNRLLLSRNGDHFLFDGRDLDERYDQFAGDGAFEEILFDITEQSLLLISGVGDDSIDISSSPIQPEHAAGAESADGVELLSGDKGEFYMLGFNTRRHPMGNYQFRSAVARLIDRQYSVDEIMYGHADPSDTPLLRTDYLADEFAWGEGGNLGPFPGENGEVDQKRARDVFRDAGFRYSDGGNLVTRN